MKTRVDIFNQKFNCSQSVFSAFATRLGLDKETALKLASPFGGGVARRGEICGAVSGALLVLGLARGADEPAGKDEIYRLSQEFMRLFEEKHATVICRDLLSTAISVPRMAGKWRKRQGNLPPYARCWCGTRPKLFKPFSNNLHKIPFYGDT